MDWDVRGTPGLPEHKWVARWLANLQLADTATNSPPWTLTRISHLFHTLTKSRPPAELLLNVAHRCYRRSLRVTSDTVPYAPALVLLGKQRSTCLTTTVELGPWHAVDIHTLGDLYSEGGLIQFTALSLETGLPPGQFLLYNSLLRALSRKNTVPPLALARRHSFMVWAEAEEAALRREDAMGLRRYHLSASWDEMLTQLQGEGQVVIAGDPMPTDNELAPS
ncbi:hypothetical protein NDU88_006953 [Pleurodeles waltl]|uniref:Uncharacterized protein n=1 Tax=Pleurodeles waltl TaxID=8319 RepID=A0AAV7RN09_PLEWA|nr:hypothetical protein NDU88_006953 [Pleurodeles waltl]